MDHSLPELTAEELERYCRQIGGGVLSPTGQRRLKAASVLVTRAGGMGGPAALCLTMAGIGRVVLAHGGEMIPADLNRQLLGSEACVGKPRAAEFAAYLRSMNRHVTVEAIDHEPVDDAEAQSLARGVDVILSCPPTFAERLRLNRAALAAGVPLVDAAQWGMMGTLLAVAPGRTACLRCLYPRDPEFEEFFPVIGAISSAIGSLAALEAIKIVTGDGQPLFGKLLTIDGFGGYTNVATLARAADCVDCRGVAPTVSAFGSIPR